MAGEIWAAVAAGVGGIFGGIIAGYITYRYNRKLEIQKSGLETKSLLIEKVIEAYENIYELKKYLSDRKQNSFALVNSKEKIMVMKRVNVEDFIHQANTLLNSKHSIYLPKALRKDFFNFRNLLFEIIHHPSSLDQNEFEIQKERIRLSIDQYIKNINQQIRDFNPEGISDIKKIIAFINNEE